MATTKTKSPTKTPIAKKPGARSAPAAPAEKVPQARTPLAKKAPPEKGAPKAPRAPTEGQKAPPFSLPGTDGKTHTLEGYAGKNVVLYFYPKDDTPGCTREAIAFHGIQAALAKKNAVVLGVSKDSIASHCRFQDKHGLGFVLLSDPDLSVHGAYGAYGEKVMYGKKTMGVIRSTFVIGPDGKIKKAFPKVKVDGHDQEVLAVL